MVPIELTPEQGRVVVGSSEPVAVCIPSSEQQYFIIAKEALESLKERAAYEHVEYQYHDIRDEQPDEL